MQRLQGMQRGRKRHPILKRIINQQKLMLELAENNIKQL